MYKKLIVYAHGYIKNGNAWLLVGKEHQNLQEKRDGSIKQISDFFIQADINFCKKAILDIRSCNIGKISSIKQDIEKYYKEKGVDLRVKTYPYYITPAGKINIFRYSLIPPITILISWLVEED